MHDDSDHIDTIFHIEEMKAELEALSEGKMVMGTLSDALPPEVEEQFLESVLDYERAEMVTHKELLARDGVALPAPDELSDEELALKLIEVIHTLADHHIFLENTNHLDDRALYTYLYADVLEESGPILPPDNPMNCHVDLVGSGSDEHVQLWLAYYADEDTRREWATDFADIDIPPHQDPPYDRDRHLPKPPEPVNPYEDPAVVEAFCGECRGKLERKLATDGIIHGGIVEEPLSYAPDIACVWAILRANSSDTEWWALSGDVPTTYLPAADYPDPRAFLHAVSAHMRAVAEALETGDPPPELTIGAPKDWPHLIPMLEWRADLLERWADDDDAWED